MWAWLLLAATAFAQATPAAPDELRQALEGLRGGALEGAGLESAAARLPQLLATGTDDLVRGAAFLVGVHGRKECVPALIAALEHENLRPQDGSAEPTRSLLDALVRLGATVPADTLLARPQGEFAAQTYLLLARAKDPDLEGLVRFTDLGWRHRPAHWAGLDRLAGARDPRGAERLLVATPWVVEFEVSDDGVTNGSGGTNCKVACSARPQWPPRVAYTLLREAESTAEKLVAHTRSERVTCWPREVPLSTDAQRAWRLWAIERANPGRSSSELSTTAANRHHAFVSDAAYLEAVAAQSTELERCLDATIRQFAEQGLLHEPDAVARRLRIEVTIRDLRGAEISPLPQPPARERVRFFVL